MDLVAERAADKAAGADVVVAAKGVEKPLKLRYLHSSPWYEVYLPVGTFHIER